MDQKELDRRLELHDKWLSGKDDGERLNLCDSNLMGTDMRYAKLMGTDMRYANLMNAKLMNAKLMGADMRYAKLMGTDMRNTSLMGTDMRYANLMDADLAGAITSGAIGVTAICAQVNTSAQNRLISYYPALDVVTAGCWQSSMAEFKQRVKDVYGDEEDGNAFLYARYQRVIAFLEQEAEADKEKDDCATSRQGDLD